MITRTTCTAIFTTFLCTSTNAFSNVGIQRSGEIISKTQVKASNSAEPIPLKKGSTVALVTPFLPNGDIDQEGLRTLFRFHKENQTDGLCVLGTTGEASLLTMEERKIVLDIAVEECKGTIPLLIGTGAINPVEVKEMTLQAMDCGADAALVVSPPYIKPPQRGLVDHFTNIAKLGLPVVVYNVPGRTGVDITPESIGLCAQMHENIVGVKEATGDVSRVKAIRDIEKEINVGRELLLYSGDDSTEAEFVLSGGDGCISVTANVAPKQMHDMMMAALDGNRDETMRINETLKSIHSDIFCESNPIPAKWATKRLGKIDNAICRPPLAELDEKFHSVVEAALGGAGLI